MRDAVGNACEEGGAQVGARLVYADGDTTRGGAEAEVADMGNGQLRVAWCCQHAASCQLLLSLGSELLPCSLSLSVYAGPPSASRTEVILPANSHILPLKWNLVRVCCRDRCGNPTELPNPAALTVSCQGAEMEHVSGSPLQPA